MQELTANRVGGRATGALFFTGFGAIWILLGLYAKERLTTAAVSAVIGGAAVLTVGAVALLRRVRSLPRAPEDPAVARAFKWINIGEWVVVAVVAFSFSRLGIDAYVISAITAIVGLHMFPLARLFRSRLHHAIGAALVAWAVASVFLFGKDELQGSTALGTGTILWLSALLALALAARVLRAQPKAAERRAETAEESGWRMN
jgi:lysylphosphatidylglycerol synthetase-like protein (DUF2156 family)